MVNRIVLATIELWLSAAGLIVIGAVPVLLGAEHTAYWQVAAVTAVGVGLIHGLIFWFVRQRQRSVRRNAIAGIRTMLQDQINNRLTHVSLHVAAVVADESYNEIDEIQSSLAAIAQLLDTISEESMREWRATYAKALA